jgi:hypothetical protein
MRFRKMKKFTALAIVLLTTGQICANSNQQPDPNLSEKPSFFAPNLERPSQQVPKDHPRPANPERKQPSSKDSTNPAFIYAIFYAPENFRLNSGDLVPFSETTVATNITLNENGSLTFHIPGTYEIIYGVSTSSASGVPANGPVFALFSGLVLPGSSLFTGTNYGPAEPKMSTLAYILSNVVAGQNLSVRSLLGDTRLGTGQFGPPMGITAFISVKKIYP